MIELTFFGEGAVNFFKCENIWEDMPSIVCYITAIVGAFQIRGHQDLGIWSH